MLMDGNWKRLKMVPVFAFCWFGFFFSLPFSFKFRLSFFLFCRKIGNGGYAWNFRASLCYTCWSYRQSRTAPLWSMACNNCSNSCWISFLILQKRRCFMILMLFSSSKMQLCKFTRWCNLVQFEGFSDRGLKVLLIILISRDNCNLNFSMLIRCETSKFMHTYLMKLNNKEDSKILTDQDGSSIQHIQSSIFCVQTITFYCMYSLYRSISLIYICDTVKICFFFFE